MMLNKDFSEEMTENQNKHNQSAQKIKEKNKESNKVSSAKGKQKNPIKVTKNEKCCKKKPSISQKDNSDKNSCRTLEEEVLETKTGKK